MNINLSTLSKTKIKYLLVSFLVVFLTACESEHADEHGTADEHNDVELVKGPHNGRILNKGNFNLELAIFETGVPPEFRIWATENGKVISPEQLKVNIVLSRLGGIKDNINFSVQGDALRGDMVIYEPHSFVVTINARYNNAEYQWQYDNFEGRTRIEPEVAKAMSIKTSVASSAVIDENIELYGKIVSNANNMSRIAARFPGVIKSLSINIGDTVTKGQKLASVESNDSLNVYSIYAPISGVVTELNASIGSQTGNDRLFTVVDNSQVWAELLIFPADLNKIKVGAVVQITNPATNISVLANITNINSVSETNQAVKARVSIDNKNRQFLPASFIKAKIQVTQHKVDLAVKRSGLQAFRDFTVVYAKVDDQYEVRMLELGKADDELIEVISGLKAGTEYVSENSYIIKADIEKSGAAHDH